MKLVRFCGPDGTVRGGALADGAITDFVDLSITDLVRRSDTRDIAYPKGGEYRLEDVRLLPPILPGKVICCGINFKSHLDENADAVVPPNPFLFAKLASSVIGPEDGIVLPAESSQIDYEVEFAAVIGRRMQRVKPADALGYVFGYTVVNDVSARDIQFVDHQITLAKSIDSFCPIGPCIVTSDELADISDLELWTTVNGEERQRGRTSEWFFPLPQLLAFISSFVTLEPGDVVTTGTPAGVGAFREPPSYLSPGDRVTVAVERIGELTNPVVAGWA